MKRDRYDMTSLERKEHLESIGKETTWPAAGLIYCERECVWCASINVKTGECTNEGICCMHDSEYIKEDRARVERKKKCEKEKAERRIKEADEEEAAKKNIRVQNKTEIQLIEEEIAKKNRLATWHFKYARPNQAEHLLCDVRYLENKKRLLLKA